MTTTGGQLALLRGNPRLRSLWASRFVSNVGSNVSLVALLVYLARAGYGPFAVVLLMLAGDFLPSLLSPVCGAISDRFDLRRVMITCEVAQAGLVLALAVSLPPVPILVVLVFLRALAGAIFQPASQAAVPALVADKDLEQGNAAIGFSSSAPEIVGPALAAALYSFLGVRGLLSLDAVTFVVSAVLLVALPTLPPRPREPRALLADARDGLAYLWHHPIVRIITLGFVAVVFCNAADDVALVFLATDNLHASAAGASVLYAGVGIGLLAGFSVMGRLSRRVPTAVLLVTGYAVCSLGNLLTGLAGAVVVALGFQAIRGAAISAMDVGHQTLIQRVVPAPMLGRVFANVYGLVGVAAGLSYLVSGPALIHFGARATLVVGGAAGLVATALVGLRLSRALRAAGSSLRGWKATGSAG